MGTFGTNRIYTVGRVVKVEDLLRFERVAPRGFDSLRISNAKFINIKLQYVRISKSEVRAAFLQIYGTLNLLKDLLHTVVSCFCSLIWFADQFCRLDYLYTRTHSCTRHTHTHTNTYEHAPTTTPHTCALTLAHTHREMHAHAHVHTHTLKHACVRMHTHTHTHILKYARQQIFTRETR